MEVALADWVAPVVPWTALAIALPLAAALAAAVSQRVGHALAVPVGLGGIAIALAAALQVSLHGPAQLAVGGWRPPLGIALRLDGLGSLFLLTGALVAAAALASARPVLHAGRRGWAFWPMAYFLLAALNAVFAGADLFNLYVALELVTVAAVALVALEGTRDAIAAALRYLLFALLGSLAFLLGVALVYTGHGTLDLLQLRLSVAAGAGTALPVVLATAGLMAKAALFPLHGWLAAAHASAPAPASALLSALVVKAPFLVLLRLWSDTFAELGTPAFGQLLGALGAAGILLGSVLALRQQRLKLVIAYSTVAQLGYLLLVFPLLAAGPAGDGAWSGAVLHALAHALAKGAMFLAAGSMALSLGHDRIDGLAGLGSRLPLAAFAFGLAAISLMGLPPSGGFLAKYLLLTAALRTGQWWWALVMLAGGLLAAGYLFRPLGQLLATAPPQQLAPVPRGPQALALALALCAVVLGLTAAEPLRLLQVGRGAFAP